MFLAARKEAVLKIDPATAEGWLVIRADFESLWQLNWIFLRNCSKSDGNSLPALQEATYRFRSMICPMRLGNNLRT